LTFGLAFGIGTNGYGPAQRYGERIRFALLQKNVFQGLWLVAARSYPHNVGPPGLQVCDGEAACGVGRGRVTSPRRNMNDGDGRSGNSALIVGLDVAS
jgi:hypothetical protein